MSQEYIKCNYIDLEDMKDDIIRIIERSSNCYLTALDLMINSPDFYKTKSSRIAYKVMAIFQEWLKDSKNADEHLLNLEIKIKALYAVLEQSNRSLIVLVCEIYKIAEDGNKLYHIIENLIRNNRFPEAAICIMTLNLQDKFELEDVVIPLILQNKHNVVEDFIKSNRDLQIKLVMYLDNLHCNLSELRKVLSKFSSLKGLRRDQLNNKSIDKLLKKLLKNYDIPNEYFPRYTFQRTLSSLKYYIRRKYFQKDITEDCWNDMITIIIEDNVDLQKEFIMELICLNDMECAIKWVKFLNLPIREFPPSLQKASEENKNNKLTLTFKHEDETDSSNYLQLRLNFNNIHMIDTPEEYLKCLNDISENAIVGIDAEWKPTLGFQKSRVALLQLAVWDNIYLLDMIQLRKCLKPDQWDVLLEKIFCNNELIKLGYGLQNDFDMLKEFFKEGKDKLKKRANILDLYLFYETLKSLHPEVTEKFRRFKRNENTLYTDHKGLSGLAEIILGKPLSKEECTSNWENRPLRKSQVIYAALDAYCLLEIYESIHNKVHHCELDFNQIVRDFLSQKIQKVSSKKKTSQKNKKKFTPPLQTTNNSQTMNNSLCTIKDVKFVVDNMLNGLGKFLRKCGSDTKCLENSDDHTEAAKIALKEDRIILTSGAPYFQLKSYLPEGRCFNVPCSQNAKEQAMTVFKHFNIKINEEDIFSRCSVCNGDDYLEIDNYQMKEIWTRYQQFSNSTSEDRQELTIDNEKIFVTNINKNSSSPINIKIQISELSAQALSRVENFLLCTNCGKIYWQGSHFDRMRKAMSNILTETGQTIYSINDEDEIEEEIKNFTIREYESGLSNYIFKACEHEPPEVGEEKETASSSDDKTQSKYAKEYEVEYDSPEDDDQYEMVFNF